MDPACYKSTGKERILGTSLTVISTLRTKASSLMPQRQNIIVLIRILPIVSAYVAARLAMYFYVGKSHMYIGFTSSVLYQLPNYLKGKQRIITRHDLQVLIGHNS